MRARWLTVMLGGLAAACLGGCGSEDGSGGPAGGRAPEEVVGEALPPPEDPFETLPSLESGTLARRLRDAGEFGRFLSELVWAEAFHELEASEPRTVFAPTDGAFQRMAEETLASLRRDRAAWRRMLLHHIVPGRVTAEDLGRTESLETLAGTVLPVRRTGGAPEVGGAGLEMVDVEASNGLIHSVDRVLVPPEP